MTDSSKKAATKKRWNKYDLANKLAELFCARQVVRACEQLAQRLDLALLELKEPGKTRDPFNILHECWYQADCLKRLVDSAGFEVAIGEDCISYFSKVANELDSLQDEQVDSSDSTPTPEAAGDADPPLPTGVEHIVIKLRRLLESLEELAKKTRNLCEDALREVERGRREKRAAPRRRLKQGDAAVGFWVLILGDLHLGADDLRQEWRQILGRFYRDLVLLEREVLKGEPWDLIALAGDLIGKGRIEHFGELDKILHDRWEYWGEKNWVPFLVATPGNHDLVRPGLDDSWARLLLKFDENPDLVDKVFGDHASPQECRKVIDDAFEAYTTWWKGQRRRWPGAGSRPGQLTPGVLPGEFYASVEKGEGTTLGIVGLNSSFLHLADTDRDSSRLAVLLDQFNAAGGPEWCEQQDVRVLLTHHPYDWLHAESRQTFRQSIDAPGHFALHISGHRHESYSSEIATMGNISRRHLINSSLCGRRPFRSDEDRCHGYTALRIVRDKDLVWHYRYWPRLAMPESGWEFQPDRRYSSLEHDNGTKSVRIDK